MSGGTTQLESETTDRTTTEFVKNHALEIASLPRGEFRFGDIERVLPSASPYQLSQCNIIERTERVSDNSSEFYWTLRDGLRDTAHRLAPARCLPCRCTGFTNAGDTLVCGCGFEYTRDTVKRCLFGGDA